jgi:hypothetical protein
MVVRVTEIVFDCHDPVPLAAFWTAALDYHVVSADDEQIEIAAWAQEPPGQAERVRAAATVPTLVFVRVPEGKAVKNRLHLDVRPTGPYEEELQRLIDLGATRVDIGQGGVPWVVLADPEGNEFCLLGPHP